MRLIRAIAAMLLLISLFSSTASAQTTVTPDQYIQLLEDAALLAESSAADPRPARMRNLREFLGYPITVAGPRGDIEISTDPYLDSLSGSRASDFRSAGQHLVFLALAAKATPGATSPDADRVARSLAVALGTTQQDLSLIERLDRWLRLALNRAITWFVGFLAGNRGVSTLFAWSVFVIVLGLLTWLIVSRLRLLPEAKRRPLQQDREDVDWRAVAEEALAAGKVPEAARALFRLIVQALAERGALEDRPSLTAGECRAAVGGGMPALYEPVAGATRIFERAVYGEFSVAPDDLQKMREAEAEIRSWRGPAMRRPLATRATP